MHILQRTVSLPAPGRLPQVQPVAVVDIGSNSVRLVVYEGLTRVPAPLFNEKILAGLGRNMAASGCIAPEAYEVALKAIARFAVLLKQLQVNNVHVLATAAVRDANNGFEFMQQVERLIGHAPHIISGEREAELAALGVVSGFIDPHGIVGDLGGGSVEFVPVRGTHIDVGESLPLGGLRLAELSGGDVRKAARLVKTAISQSEIVKGLKGQNFFAVGGSWRSLAKLHMAQTHYPLRVMHNYRIPAKEALEFCRMVTKTDINAIVGIEAVSNDRRPLLAYGALVLEEVIAQGKPEFIKFSALGVREGLLFSLLSPQEQAQDPLLATAEEFALLRSRSPAYVHELCTWSDAFMQAIAQHETPDDTRLRHAACLFSDLSWRAHPDYRGEQSFNIIAHAAFIGVRHPARIFLALAAFHRHAGLNEVPPTPNLLDMLSPEMHSRARIIGALIRVAHALCACTPGTILRTSFVVSGKTLVLHIPADLADLAIQRLNSRMKQLAKLLNLSADIVVAKA